MTTNDQKSQPSGLRVAVVKYKFAVAGLATLALGLALVVLAATRTSYSVSYGSTRSELIDSGLSEGEISRVLDNMSFGADAWTSVLAALGASFLGIAIIALAWDLWIHLSWLRVVRDEVVSALVDPVTARRVGTDLQARILEQVLEDRHGSEVGRALLGESEKLREANRGLRRDFVYNIQLAPGDRPGFHRAEFRVSFTVLMLATPPVVAFSQVRDTLDFHSRYEEHTDNSPHTIYRYILHSSEPCDPHLSFQVLDAAVASPTDQSGRVKLFPSQVDTRDPESISFELKPRKQDKKQFRLLSLEECRITLGIRTVVDARRAEFPIWLAYPVKKFRSRMDISGIGAAEVDVLEFFTAATRYEREDMITGTTPEIEGSNQADLASASGFLNDLILPNSGLTYIWRARPSPPS